MDDQGDKSPLEVLLTCPVCQDIFKEPRQLPCGHSICMSCLENMIDHSVELPFRCPDCRAYFGEVVGVHALAKSYTLASIVEDYKETAKEHARKTVVVYCDCCRPETEEPAAKTCLKCEVSLCGEHLKDHLERPAFEGHPLVRPLADLQQRKCPQHEDQVLRYYCTASRRYVCNVCTLDAKHSSLATEASGVLGRRLMEYMDQRFEILEAKMTESQDSIQTVRDDILNEKINPKDSSLHGVTMVLLCLWVIVLYYSYNFSVENQTLTETVKGQRTQLQDLYSTVAEFLVEHPLHLHGDAEDKQEVPLTLDLRTVSPFLEVSADLRSVERVKAKLDHPSLPTRFDDSPQVLSTQCYGAGTHVWVVETAGHWDVAVSYQGIQRKGSDRSPFGTNAHSWSLAHEGRMGRLSASHNGTRSDLPATLEFNRIAVVVDSGEGTIAFAEVGAHGALTVLHEFRATLTHPVCLGVALHSVEPPSRASILRASSTRCQTSHQTQSCRNYGN